jgi:protein-tyrosine kinase
VEPPTGLANEENDRMSSEPETIDPYGPNADEELSRTLVQLNRLSQDAVEQINVLMQTLHLRFAEAALQSGAVSQQELEEAQEWMGKRGLGKPGGLIEEMMRRTARKRDVILWEHDQLEPAAELILPHQPDHPYSESMRSLRTELLLRCKASRGIITVLSPCSGDGRSRLAAELAIAFAQLERRTLLVDADLRKPSLHRLFGTENDMGLAQALTKSGPHHFHGINGLPEMALITSGEVPKNPLELISGRGFERAIREWRRNFEFVILDTPPVTRYSDAVATAAVTGNVLLLGRAKATKFKNLHDVCRNLSAAHCRILGATINSF